MKSDQARPTSADPAVRQGIAAALGKTFGLAAAPLLIDTAADAAFASSIARLRGEPGSHNGGKQ